MWQLLLHSPKWELRVNKFNIWHNLAHSSNKKCKLKARHDCQIPCTCECSSQTREIEFVTKKSIWGSCTWIFHRQPDEMFIVSTFFYRSTPLHPSPPCHTFFGQPENMLCNWGSKVILCKANDVKLSFCGKQLHYILAIINRRSTWLSEQSVSQREQEGSARELSEKKEIVRKRERKREWQAGIRLSPNEDWELGKECAISFVNSLHYVFYNSYIFMKHASVVADSVEMNELN